MAKANLTAQRLHELFHYDSETGRFFRHKTAGKARAGMQAGTVNVYGYRQVCVDGTVHLEHRLAFLYVEGRWPDGVVDHINGDKTDNRWCNLRDVDGCTNMQNQRRPKVGNPSGLLGVSKKRGKWRSRIFVGGKEISLGVFDDANDAHLAYVNAKRILHRGGRL